MKLSQILVPVFAGIAGFIGGSVFENHMIKKKIQKLVDEERQKGNNVVTNVVINNEEKDQKVVLNTEKFEEITAEYRSSEEKKEDKKEEKAESKAVVEVKGGGVDSDIPFRTRKFASGARICNESEFRNAEERECIDYYTGDDAFFDEDGNRIEDWENRFGTDIVDYFGTTSDDMDSVHLYNKEEDVYYEIKRHMGYVDPK